MEELHEHRNFLPTLVASQVCYVNLILSIHNTRYFRRLTAVFGDDPGLYVYHGALLLFWNIQISVAHALIIMEAHHE